MKKYGTMVSFKKVLANGEYGEKAVMKKLGYLLFALVFDISRIFNLNKKKIVLYNGQYKGLSGNLLEIKNEIESRRNDVSIYYFEKNKMFSKTKEHRIKGLLTFFFVFPFHLATAHQVFLNDNFIPLTYCMISKKAQFIQMWHGAGAFKKFGLSTERDRKVKGRVEKANRKITHLFVTSKQVIPYYEWSFAIPRRKIYATGVPVTDIYFDEDRISEGKRNFYKEYPNLEGRKFILITPTIRKSQKENMEILSRYPFERMHKVLGDSWIFLIKMHPKMRDITMPLNEYCINVTNYQQITDLFFVSELLIADYSSTVVEYALLNKPIILYAYDLLYYDRGFFRDYREHPAGQIVETEEELLEAVKHPRDNESERQEFLKQHYDFFDDRSIERVLQVLEETKIDS